MPSKGRSAVVLTGVRVDIRRSAKKGRPVADIYWRGVRVAKVLIKDGGAVTRLYGKMSQPKEAIPLDHFRSALGLAESRLKADLHGE